jgi:hypothetical protein
MRAVAASGADVNSFAGLNLPISMTATLSPTGEYDDTAFGPFGHAQAMLGLLDAGLPVDPSAVTWLVEAQDDEGGWGGPDATGVSLQVMARLDGDEYEGVTSPALTNLRATQQSDGGWGFDLPSSVNSTSEVAQGLTSAGANPFDPGWSVIVSGTLLSAADVALSQQGPNGCWPNLFGEGDDPYATTDGIILLSLAPPWDMATGVSEDGDADAAEDAGAVDDPTPTAEVVVEATEMVPTPTAATEAGLTTAEPEDLPTPSVQEPGTPPQVSLDGNQTGSPGSLVIWIILALGLLIGAMIYFRVSSRR